MNDFMPTIQREGQAYVDEPVVVKPRPISTLERSLAAAFGRSLPEPITVGHERVFLRWWKLDGNGSLIPRSQGR